MVGGRFDREMTEQARKYRESRFNYDNRTLFEDLDEFDQEMKEATFLESDIYGNEIEVWESGNNKGTAELAIEFLYENSSEEQVVMADGGQMKEELEPEQYEDGSSLGHLEEAAPVVPTVEEPTEVDTSPSQDYEELDEDDVEGPGAALIF